MVELPNQCERCEPNSVILEDFHFKTILIHFIDFRTTVNERSLNVWEPGPEIRRWDRRTGDGRVPGRGQSPARAYGP